MPTCVSAHTHTHRHTHPQPQVSGYCIFLLFPPLFFYHCSLSKKSWRLQCLTQTSLDSNSFQPTNTKVCQILSSLSTWQLQEWQSLSCWVTVKATIKILCLYTPSRVIGNAILLITALKMRCNLVLRPQVEVFSWLVYMVVSLGTLSGSFVFLTFF